MKRVTNLEIELVLAVERGVLECLHDGDIGVLERSILSHQAYVDFLVQPLIPAKYARHEFYKTLTQVLNSHGCSKSHAFAFVSRK